MDNKSSRFGFAGNVTSLIDFGDSRNVSVGAEYDIDTVIRLESPGSSSLYNSSLTGTKRKWSDFGKDFMECGSLELGLGRSPSSSESIRVNSAIACTMFSAKESDELSSMELGVNCHLQLGNQSTAKHRDSAATSKALNNGCILDLQLSLSTGASESVITSVSAVPLQQQDTFEASIVTASKPSIAEGSISSCSKFSTHLSSHLYTSDATTGLSPNQQTTGRVVEAPNPDISSTMLQLLQSPVVSSSTVTQHFNTSTKKCLFHGCAKGARGASGLCIAHGGGKRCQKYGCDKGAEGKTNYCKAHGGGRRCEHIGCAKSAEGRTCLCIAHGGGRRCTNEGCSKAARGKSGLCIKHGGGKRCKKENCTKSAEGQSGLCISHGGGRRCQHPECSKGAQGSTMLCKAHGGGKRCTSLGCNKGAEGSTPFCKGHGGGKRCSFKDGCTKSVHGGTQFCVAHGGGKRCAEPECTKSARGSTAFCVGHGGGKRCKSDGCRKSAQGSTDYCKAHGGGKRCSWGQIGSDLGTGGLPCGRLSRGKAGLCATHTALVQDQCVHGGALQGNVSGHPLTSKLEKMKGVVALDEFMLMNLGNNTERLVGANTNDQKKFMHQAMVPYSGLLSLPEGRVHGGGLFAMLASSSSGQVNLSGGQVEGDTSEQGIQHKFIREWL